MRITSALITFLLVSGVSSSSCPPAELIAPRCACHVIFGDPMMVCNNLVNADALAAPILATLASRHSLFSLEIINSSLLYIPHDLLKGTGIQYIRLENSQLMSLSDTDIAFEGLEDTLLELRATSSNYVSTWDWNQLRNLNRLNLIDVHRIQMGSVTEPFPELVGLNALGLSDSGLEDIVDYAFAELKKLKILVLKSNAISGLARNMFPYPANELVVLDLSENELETLPKDMFQSMPKLENVFLDNNRFTTLNEDVFKGPFQSLSILSLKGNKMTCDCRMQWIVGLRSPFDFIGTCAHPKTLSGRHMQSLEFNEMWC